MENTFSKALQKIMEERGLNQHQLARAARVTQPQINAWLAGRTLPHYKSIQQLCKFLNINGGVFFD